MDHAGRIAEKGLQRLGIFRVVELAAFAHHRLHLDAHDVGDQHLRLPRRAAPREKLVNRGLRVRRVAALDVVVDDLDEGILECLVGFHAPLLFGPGCEAP